MTRLRGKTHILRSIRGPHWRLNGSNGWTHNLRRENSLTTAIWGLQQIGEQNRPSLRTQVGYAEAARYIEIKDAFCKAL